MANRRFIDFPIATTVGDSDIILIWQSGVNKQTTKATFLSGLPDNLDELNDVAISGLTNGQILRYDSTTGKWENTDQGNLDLNDLNDVSIVSPSNGQVLVYNSSTSKWENSSGGFVPYVGAVTTVDLGAQGLRAGYVRFDTSVVTVPDEQGLMYWDATKSTVALIMNGTLQHIGQDTFFYCKNSTGSSIPKGTSVRFAGTDGASGHILITPFLANGSVPSNYFIGVTAEVISNGSFGQVMHFGELTGINTSGYTAGALLYASTTVAGGFQTTAPVAPNNIVLVAAAVNSKNNGAIVVRPTYGSNINTDEGVKITSGATGDLLQLQAGGLWENKTKAQILGGTASQFVKGNGSLDSTSYQPLLTNPVTGTGAQGRVAYWDSTGVIKSDALFQWNDFSKRLGIGRTPTVSLDVEGAGFFSGTVTASSIIKSGGTSSQYLMADGSVSTLTNPVTGTGTTNYLPKFTGASTIGNSQIFDNGSGIGINTASPVTLLHLYQASSTIALTLQTGSNFGYLFNDGTNIGIASNVGSTGLKFLVNRSAPDNSLSITSGGNLLVGTTTDNGARLQVSGRAQVSTLYVNSTEYTFANFASAVIGPRPAADGIANLWLRPSDASNNVGFNLSATSSTFTIGSLVTGPFLSMAISGGAATFSSSVTARGINTFLTGGFNDTTYALNASISSNASASSVAPVARFSNNGGGFVTKLMFSDNNRGDAYITHVAGSAFVPSSRWLGFGVDAVDQMIINASGNVGIGTTSPDSQLTLNGSSNSRLNMRAGDTRYGTLYADNGVFAVASITAIPLVLGTNDIERMRITSGGNVLIGTTTDNGAKLQVSGDILTSAPSGGTAGKWKLGTATSGSYTIGGKIRIEINGVAYDILTT